MKNLERALTISILLFATIWGGCKKDDPPVPSFSFTGDNRPAPCEVTFTNKSTNFTSLLWEFGDGGSSSEQNPKHTYASGGTFTVKLTASGVGGMAFVTNTVTIQEPVPNPLADFSYSGHTGYAPLTVTFTNLSQNAVSYSWDFGDGQTSTQVNPDHLYSTGGTYNVTLTAKNSVNATDAITKSIVIASLPNPVADFSFAGANTFAPRKVSFTNKSTGATSYLWEFGDGSTSTGTHPSHVYQSGGNYNVTLTARNANNAIDKITKNVSINDAPTKMILTKVVVTKMPFTNQSGAGWDMLSGPDVFFKISDDSGNDYYTSDVKNDQTSSNLPITYTTGLPYVITSLNYKFRLELWDYDNALSSDFIGGYYFTVRDYMPTNGDLYPTTIELGSQAQAIRFTLTLSWQ